MGKARRAAQQGYVNGLFEITFGVVLLKHPIPVNITRALCDAWCDKMAQFIIKGSRRREDQLQVRMAFEQHFQVKLPTSPSSNLYSQWEAWEKKAVDMLPDEPSG